MGVATSDIEIALEGDASVKYKKSREYEQATLSTSFEATLSY